MKDRVVLNGGALKGSPVFLGNSGYNGRSTIYPLILLGGAK